MNINEVFLNASEHLFNLSFSETLMLRNYSKINRGRKQQPSFDKEATY